MTAIAPRAADDRVSVGRDARVVATTVLVGAAAGALAGLVVGRLVVPAALVIGTVVGTWVTIDEASQILG